jgi:flagellar biosynthesis/type III secretory pathway protein FliH
MTTEKLYEKAASEIMALVDEFPSGPFTLERKWLEQKLVAKLEDITGLASDEDDAAYQVGYDEGYAEGKDETEQEMDQQIQDLEEQVDDLERELEQVQEDAAQAFAEGYEVGVRSGGADSVEIS